MGRSRGLIGIIALLVVAALVLWRCTGAPPRAARPDPGAALPAGAIDAGGRDAPAATSIDPAAAAALRRRNEAIQAAVSTLHRYLTALGTGDRAKSDPFWSGGTPPNVTHESDLRGLEALRSLRIENGNPKARDGEPIPHALEIPVELRASVAKGPARRYRGYYRLRSQLDNTQWEITSASIDAIPGGQ